MYVCTCVHIHVRVPYSGKFCRVQCSQIVNLWIRWSSAKTAKNWTPRKFFRYTIRTCTCTMLCILSPYLPACNWLVGPDSGPSICSLLPFPVPLPRPLLVLSDRNLFPTAPMASFSGHVDALLGGIPVSRPGIVPLRIWRICGEFEAALALSLINRPAEVGGAWTWVGLGVGLGVARRKSAKGRCSFFAVRYMVSPLSRQCLAILNSCSAWCWGSVPWPNKENKREREREPHNVLQASYM